MADRQAPIRAPKGREYLGMQSSLRQRDTTCLPLLGGAAASARTRVGRVSPKVHEATNVGRWRISRSGARSKRCRRLVESLDVSSHSITSSTALSDMAATTPATLGLGPIGTDVTATAGRTARRLPNWRLWNGRINVGGSQWHDG